jgi:hypothetical protein
MRPATEVVPELVEAYKCGKLRVRGPQRSPTKVPVYIRLSPEVVEYFKAQGARMADAPGRRPEGIYRVAEMTMRELDAYPFEITPCPRTKAGVFDLLPDFNVCISDGETIEETAANGGDAVRAVIGTLEELGRPCRGPPAAMAIAAGSPGACRKVCMRSWLRARREGVSMNALAATMLAEALGRRGSARDDNG